MKYRKKPVIIEAVQWTGHNKVEIYEFLSGDSSGDVKLQGENHWFIKNMSGIPETLCVKTLWGYAKANEGDYIIKDVDGKYHTCNPNIFAETYEVAENEIMWTPTHEPVDDINIGNAKYYNKPDLIVGDRIDGSILVINSEGK